MNDDTRGVANEERSRTKDMYMHRGGEGVQCMVWSCLGMF